jgi:MFS family permease
LDFSAIQSVFANANFRHYVYGNFCSQFGLWVQRVAVAWLTWELTKSPFWLGLMAFADFAPAILCAPLAGAVADRIDRLRGIKITQVLGGIQGVVLVVLTGTGTITVEILLVLTFLLGIVLTFNQPFRLAVIPSLVAAKDMSAAVSINSLTFNIARISGPAVAGITILRLGIMPCFVICALSYFIFAIALMFVRIHEQVQQGERKTLRDLPSEIMAGIRYCRSHVGIGPVMVLMAVVAISGRPFAELLPAFAAEVFERGADGFALLTGAMGVGAIIGGMTLATRTSVTGLTNYIVLNVLILGLVVFSFSVAPIFWVALILVCVSGFAQVVIGIGEQTLVQNASDPSMRGRVLSLYGMINRAGPAIGALIMGALAEVLGLRWPVMGGAVVMLLFLFWLMPRRKTMAASLEGEPPGGVNHPTGSH